MEKLTVVSSLLAPLDRVNIDTDQIIPKQFLRSIRRTGFGQFLFDEWRYLDRGELGMDCAARPKNPDFPLNDARYQDAAILLTRDNFGCGSSREHAVWALLEYGFRVIIAPSFGEIFAGNAVKNGLLPLALPSAAVDELFNRVNRAQAGRLFATADLPAQKLRVGDDEWAFELDADNKQQLLEGIDDIAATLRHSDEIAAFEKQRRELEPWLFNDKRL